MGSDKVYTTAEIEKVEQEVIAHKNLLNTLKLDTSVEDYMVIKNEFEELKTQIAHVESVEDAVGQKSYEQIEQHDNEGEQVSLQLASLNRMVEEVLATLNKVVIGETKKEQAKEITAPRITPHNEAKQHEQQVYNSASQLTYHQLRNLVGQSVDYPQNKEPITFTQHMKTQLTLQQQRHFNPRYFQSTHAQPSNIYNGLYKNMRIKVSSKLKNIGQIRMSGGTNRLTVQPSLADFFKHQNIQPVISNEVPASISKANQPE